MCDTTHLQMTAHTPATHANTTHANTTHTHDTHTRHTQENMRDRTSSYAIQSFNGSSYLMDEHTQAYVRMHKRTYLFVHTCKYVYIYMYVYI